MNKLVALRKLVSPIFMLYMYKTPHKQYYLTNNRYDFYLYIFCP